MLPTMKPFLRNRQRSSIHSMTVPPVRSPLPLSTIRDAPDVCGVGRDHRHSTDPALADVLHMPYDVSTAVGVTALAVFYF
jgi:hypothetical protein